MEKILKRFNFNSGKNDQFKLVNNPSHQDIQKAMRLLFVELKNNKDKPITIFYVFASHGV